MLFADEVTTKIITTDFIEKFVLGILALVVPYLTYRLGAKKVSGKVNSSEADTLWRENEAVKKGYLAEVIEQKAINASLRSDIQTLKLDSIRTREENLKIRMRLGWYRVLRREYIAEIELLQEEILVLQGHIKSGELKDTDDRLEAAQRVWNRLDFLKKRILATDSFDAPEDNILKKDPSGEVKVQ